MVLIVYARIHPAGRKAKIVLMLAKSVTEAAVV
jgi:hypothetical protein